MDTLLSLWRSLVGSAPNYFTIGTSLSPQWHYGNLLEYAFCSIAAILVLSLVIKVLVTFFNMIFKGK